MQQQKPLFYPDGGSAQVQNDALGGEHFDDLQKAFSRPKYNGLMDFACRLDNGEYALIEMQVYPENTFDKRALAYISSFYGGQLFQGEKMKNMKRVVGINILAGSLDHWKGSHEFMRHYRFQNQLGDQKTPRYLEGMELIQYSIAHAPKNMKNRDLRASCDVLQTSPFDER